MYGNGATTGMTTATIRVRLRAIQQEHKRALPVFYGAATGMIQLTSVGRRVATAPGLTSVTST